MMHHASCIIDEPPVMNLLWFDRVLLPETSSSRSWWFALRVSAVICLRVRPWPRRFTRTPLWRIWIWGLTTSALKPIRPVFPGGEVFALLGARVRGLPKNPTSRVLHKPPSKGHSGPSKACNVTAFQGLYDPISGIDLRNGQIRIDF